MPAERLSMRKIREVLRLKFDRRLSNREIALTCSIGRTTVSEYLQRAGRAGLEWPVDIDDEKLERLLFLRGDFDTITTRPVPDWVELHKELKRKAVTLALLWQEYKAIHPEGYQYTQFCELYRVFLGSVDPVMRQKHKAAEKLFEDYAGQTISIDAPATGTVREAQLFLVPDASRLDRLPCSCAGVPWGRSGSYRSRQFTLRGK